MSNRVTLSFLSLITCLFLTSACVGPPNEAMSAAEQVINDAMAAEVDKYAPSDFGAATAALEKAKGHMAAEEYSDAKAAAENTLALIATANQEMLVQKELTKREVDETLPAFMTRWGEISGSIEQGRGRAARALAKEAKAFVDTLQVQLNELKTGEKWHDLKMLLESANTTADSFAERAGN